MAQYGERMEVKKEDFIGHMQNGWALHYIVIKINDGVAVLSDDKGTGSKGCFNRLNNRQYANSIFCCNYLQLFGPYTGITRRKC